MRREKYESNTTKTELQLRDDSFKTSLAIVRLDGFAIRPQGVFAFLMQKKVTIKNYGIKGRDVVALQMLIFNAVGLQIRPSFTQLV